MESEDRENDAGTVYRAVKEKRHEDRERPMPPPFERHFPAEILSMIISQVQQVHQRTLPACLRVSHQWFHIAGRILYAEMCVVWGEKEGRDFTMGSDITSTRAKRKEEREAAREGRDIVQRTNFKRQLLGYVQTLTILTHHCPTGRARTSATVKALKMMTGLQRVIVFPETDDMSMESLCQKELACSILAGIRCRSFTLHEVRSDAYFGEPLELCQSLLKRVQHATFIVPPTTFFMDPNGSLKYPYGRPKDVVDWTRHLESIRLIVAVSELDMERGTDDEPVVLTEIRSLLNYLAVFIALKPTKFEIYIFNDFDNTLDLLTFRRQLEVDAIRDSKLEDSGKSSESSKAQLSSPRPTWSADHQVLGLEDYFAIPGLYLELEEWFANDWRNELHYRRVREGEEEENGGNPACQGFRG